MEMFANPKIAAWVVERLPCAFAKPNKDGSLGTHYAMVLLDKDSNVLYIGSECEHTNGEGVQVLHELGGLDDTCYTSSATFRKALSQIHTASKDLGHNRLANGSLPSAPPVEAKDLPPALRGAFNTVWESAVDAHNARWMGHEIFARSETKPKIKALNHVLAKVTYNMLGLTPMLSHGKHQERVSNTSFVKNQLSYVPIFTVAEKSFAPTDVGDVVIEGVKIEKPGDHLVMTMANQDTYYSNIFAVRDFAGPGKWSFDADPVKKWARDNHSVFTEKQAKLLGIDRRRCIFCGEDFPRMSRHVSGAKHGDRVVEVAKLACKSTSRMGLKMLNDPRHRTVFLKDR